MAKQVRKYQKEAIAAINRDLANGIKRLMLVMATGCHAKGTKILLWNGFVKNVEDIIIGEQLMGDDSTPRTVISLARGSEVMYKITPIKGEAFIVNENHILSLKRTNLPSHKVKYYPEFLNISVKEYLSIPKSKKHLYKLYRTGVDFSNGNIGSPTHPYWIGLWLGDGTVDRPCITNPDPEIEQWIFSEFQEFCKWNHPEITIKKQTPEHRCMFFDFTITQGTYHGTGSNSLLNTIREFYINSEKRISSRLLRGDKETRLQVLAGLIDSDGYMNHNNYEITTKYKGLAEDILFLVRSLGLAAYFSEKIGKIASINFEGLYYRVSISGNTNIIPCKIKRKQAKKREQIKDVLMTGFSVEKLGVDDFYGFTVDKNHLYVMGDFTVTHNCGKTFTAVKAVAPFERKIWITHNEELLDQSGSAFLKELYPQMDIQLMIDTYGGLSDYIKAARKHDLFSDMSENEIIKSIGIVKAEAFDIESDIVMASAQTLHRRLDKIRPDLFDAVICDEAHLFAAKTFIKSVNHFDPKLLLSLTATPNRADGASLADISDKISFQYGLYDAIQDAYLCEIDALQVQSKISLDNVKTTAGEFNQKDLKETIDTPERNKLLLDKYRQYANGKQSIIFCVDIEHAKNVHQAFIDAGETAEVLVGDESVTIDRRSTINRFKAGSYAHLISVNIATAGFDHPGIGAIILARPTKSLTLFFQMIGRGTRTLPGTIDGLDDPMLRRNAIRASAKPKCIVLDIVDTSTRHKLVNTWTLEKDVPVEQRTFLTEERRSQLIEVREKRKFEALSKKDKRIDLFQLPKVKLSDSLKMKDPATEKQLELLKKLGYDTEDNTYTKGDANRLINNHTATDKQIKFLQWKKYDVRNGVTIAEATAAFNEIKEREAKEEELKKIGKNSPIQGLT